MNPPTLLLGDCIEQMQFWLPDNSVDAIVTDPPYGLSFMGKKWDYDVPQVDVWAECLRVLKPGGYLLAFAGTRTQHRMCVNIEDAGFEIRDMIAWLYASGFPKSLDVSKAIDKAAGAERLAPKAGHEDFVGRDNMAALRESGALSGDGGFSRPLMFDPEKVEAAHWNFAPATDAARQWQGWGTALKPSAETITVAVKPLGDAGERHIIKSNLTKLEVRLWLLSFANVVQGHSTSSQNEYDEAFAIAQWSVAEFISTRDALYEAMGMSPFASACRSSLSIVSSWSRTLADAWTDTSMSTTSTTSSTTIDLRTLKFSLSQITPESIIRASSCPGGFNASASIAERHFNASLSLLENTRTLFATGHAISLALENSRDVSIPVQLDPCVVARKPLGERTVADNVLRWGTGGLNIDGCRVAGESTQRLGYAEMGYHGGNLAEAYQTGSALGRWPANLIHDGSDEVVSCFPADRKTGKGGGAGMGFYGGEGDADATRGYGDTGSAARFFYAAKASKADRNSGLDGKPVLTSTHPTVKPTDLMRYLCRLVTQPGGVVLDPFMGSGSTGKAARLEGFDFIGIERDPDYMRIAEARCK